MAALADGSVLVLTTAVCDDVDTARLITLTMDGVADGRWGRMRTSGELTALHTALDPARHTLLRPPTSHPKVRTIHPPAQGHPELVAGVLGCNSL
ncbi:hypothetical protein [Streptomyces sp. NPDC101776]|uniref:hypothetical protein n=1 Tax=Streptomyces sp. NPDC101776 TaxID=3366146 RepID=UPI0038027D84